MTHRVGNVVVICEEPEAACELCGTLAELRPYGPKGERICFDCAMTDKAATERGFNRMLHGGGNA